MGNGGWKVSIRMPNCVCGLVRRSDLHSYYDIMQMQKDFYHRSCPCRGGEKKVYKLYDTSVLCRLSASVTRCRRHKPAERLERRSNGDDSRDRAA